MSIHKVTYLCPDCETRIYRDIDYPDNFCSQVEGAITISTWCSRCNGIHQYEVSINPLKNGNFRINTRFFLNNGEKTNKRLSLVKA